MMMDTLQRRISKISPKAASTALVLAIVLVFGSVAAPSAHAQTFTDLYNFTGGRDGGTPYAGLIRDAAGNLYGTTYWNGISGWGTVFKVDPTGKETVLYNFTGLADGANPSARVIRDAAGNLYGTAQYGGTFNFGVVFKVDTTGTETVLYNFAGGVVDGCNPAQGLIMDKAGNLYGTAGCGATLHGVVFEITPAGKETVLHNFAGGTTDGANPTYGTLLMDTKGNLYGTTQLGGATGQGVVYRLSKIGTLTVLHSFAGGTKDGCFPDGSVAADKFGNGYGTTTLCGSSGNGVVWKISNKGKETVLHSFGGSDGTDPQSGVALDAQGNIYGETAAGGANNYGAVYELNSSGTLTVLHSFDGSDGGDLVGGVILDGKGNLYGTAATAGTGSNGTVWSLTP